MHPASAATPPRRALACGALGRYDRDRVARVAAALAPEIQVAREERNAILMLDRPAIRWSAGRRTGFGWSERLDSLAGGEVASWNEIATDRAACSLVIGGRRPFVHSTVSGVAPIYYLQSGRAVYFCSRIDPLLEAADRLLTADWDAWSAILTLGHPLGDRTPFTEIRRLMPFSTLECRRGRTRVSEGRWPWAEIEPHDRVEAAADEALAQMRAVVGRLPEGHVACPLSGGWDSRLLLGLLAERRQAETFALSASNDDGTDREERFAAAVARHLGIPHERHTGEPDAWWEDMRWFAVQTDHQVTMNPWLVPLIPRLRGADAVVADGLGLDMLAMRGGRFFSRAAVDAGGGPDGPPQLWETLVARRAPLPYRPRFLRALDAAARRQLLRESERHDGHPSRLLLTHWRNRTVRGISLNPDAALGAILPIATPFTDDGVARALLSASPKAKFGARMYQALFAAVDPALGELPSTNDGLPPEPRTLPRRRRSPLAASGFAELLLDSPLTPRLNRQALRHLTREERGRPTRVPAGALRPAVFTLWHRRYESRLRPVDTSDLLA